MSAFVDALHGASHWFESVADRHQHGIAALGALSTTAAVIVALWSGLHASRASRAKLKARVSIMQVIDQSTNLEAIPTYIAVRLTNIGAVPIRLHSTCFSWRMPLSRTAWAALPLDENGDGIIHPRRYPFVLLPNTTETIFLSPINRFHEIVPRILSSGKLSPSLAAKLLSGSVYADGGSLHPAKIGGDVREELVKISRTETVGLR